jgi:hypothetical protein
MHEINGFTVVAGLAPANEQYYKRNIPSRMISLQLKSLHTSKSKICESPSAA